MYYIGIDVSKAKLDCCVLLGERKKNKVIPNNQTGIATLLTWLQQALPQTTPAQWHTIIEGTGVYHETAATALHDAGVCVSIVNPAQVRDFAKSTGVRTKTDAVDAAVLARFGSLLKPALWQPPPAHARVLRALLARRDALSGDLQREHNRLEKVQATATVTQVQRSVEEGIAFLQQQLDKLDTQIHDHIDHHPDLKEDNKLLQSIPAVGARVGILMTGLFRAKSFDSAQQAAAYLGLTPVERQSGTSVLGKSRLSKAGPAKVRATLFMAAVVASRYNPDVKALYERLLAKGKSKMSALGAAMRKLVQLCFGVWKNRMPYKAGFAQIQVQKG